MSESTPSEPEGPVGWVSAQAWEGAQERIRDLNKWRRSVREACIERGVAYDADDASATVAQLASPAAVPADRRVLVEQAKKLVDALSDSARTDGLDYTGTGIEWSFATAKLEDELLAAIEALAAVPPLNASGDQAKHPGDTAACSPAKEPHPLAGVHINQGSMDAAAEAYEAEYLAEKWARLLNDKRRSDQSRGAEQHFEYYCNSAIRYAITALAETQVPSHAERPDVPESSAVPPLEPVAWINGDELDNLLDDRTAVVQGSPGAWRKTPLYAHPTVPLREQDSAVDGLPWMKPSEPVVWISERELQALKDQAKRSEPQDSAVEGQTQRALDVIPDCWPLAFREQWHSLQSNAPALRTTPDAAMFWYERGYAERAMGEEQQQPNPVAEASGPDGGVLEGTNRTTGGAIGQP